MPGVSTMDGPGADAKNRTASRLFSDSATFRPTLRRISSSSTAYFAQPLHLPLPLDWAPLPFCLPSTPSSTKPLLTGKRFMPLLSKLRSAVVKCAMSSPEL